MAASTLRHEIRTLQERLAIAEALRPHGRKDLAPVAALEIRWELGRKFDTFLTKHSMDELCKVVNRSAADIAHHRRLAVEVKRKKDLGEGKFKGKPWRRVIDLIYERRKKKGARRVINAKSEPDVSRRQRRAKRKA